MRLVVINHLTLDGVMQAPGHAEEDTRDGFGHGGWAAASGEDPKILEAIGKRMAVPDVALLLGRRSYEGMLGGWNERGGPFKEALNAIPKHVVSRGAETALKWPNSTLVSGDVPAAVAELKAGDGGGLVTMGSGELVRSLIPHGLVDEFLLIHHPLVLGEGRRLFEHEGAAVELRLTDSFPVASGAIVAAYEPR